MVCCRSRHPLQAPEMLENQRRPLQAPKMLENQQLVGVFFKIENDTSLSQPKMMQACLSTVSTRGRRQAVLPMRFKKKQPQNVFETTTVVVSDHCWQHCQQRSSTGLATSMMR